MPRKKTNRGKKEFYKASCSTVVTTGASYTEAPDHDAVVPGSITTRWTFVFPDFSVPLYCAVHFQVKPFKKKLFFKRTFT